MLSVQRERQTSRHGFFDIEFDADEEYLNFEWLLVVEVIKMESMKSPMRA